MKMKKSNCRGTMIPLHFGFIIFIFLFIFFI